MHTTLNLYLTREMNMQEQAYTDEEYEKLLNYDYEYSDTVVRVTPKQYKRNSTVVYLSEKEIREVIGDANEVGFALLNHYYNRAGKLGYMFTDADAAKALGWGIEKTRKIRLLLTKQGYFKKVAYKQGTKGTKVTFFYIGKAMCSKVDSVEEFAARRRMQEALMKELDLDTWEDVVKTYPGDKLRALVTKFRQEPVIAAK